MYVSSDVWCTLSHACVLYKRLCICVLYNTVQSAVVQHPYSELDLQEDDFVEFLAVQCEEFTNEDLMELEAQRNKGKRQEEEELTEEPKRFLDAGHGKWIFFI